MKKVSELRAIVHTWGYKRPWVLYMGVGYNCCNCEDISESVARRLYLYNVRIAHNPPPSDPPWYTLRDPSKVIHQIA